jgi:hypothetical protein
MLNTGRLRAGSLEPSVAGLSGARSGGSARWAGLLACLALCAAPAAAQGAIDKTAIAGGHVFSSPLHVAQPPTDDSRLFVVEKPGTIRVIKDGTLLGADFLDIQSSVRDDGSEEGLFSIAFPPNHGNGTGGTTRRFYVYFTNNSGDLRIKEFKRTKASGDLASTSYSRTVLAIPHPGEPNHNGGNVQFGPDGFLYAATGDGGSGGDPPNNAQNKNVLLGKMLRINPLPSGSKSHTNPPGNPFAGSTPGLGEIYSMGLRNPWRFSFDGQTLTIGDVGQGLWEEHDILSRSAANGANFGWSGYEGTSEFMDGNPTYEARRAAIPVHTPPVFEYQNPALQCAATVGGYIVRDSALDINGRYIYGDSCLFTDLRSFDPNDPDGTDAAAGETVSSVSSFGVDNDGHVYAASLGDGRVYLLIDTP